MNTKTPLWRYIFPIVLALLVLIYPLYWYIVIATTPVDPEQFIDPTALTIVLAIVIGLIYYGVLWVATLVYTIVLRAKRIISKRKFLTLLCLLILVFVAVALFILLA